ncbi:hypothetical protein [Thermobrachium celere]|uniref:Uncharacterized protein n=1 Tax=Thermobrachium celere DSM 8682 TaxID=941824 RepID=R7RT02_9CLOT|nr:hypothetical protein [Thermobrachium celere]GFR35217.1 hypothetical protein TCEA9_10290 [Thermobrachium celere]CDF58501.1 hypothetical protein TCEL_00547 [Thermobrachium celere DSM 8682]
MTMRKARFTNLFGHQVEFASENLLGQDRHYHREAESQKAQLESAKRHGTRKDRKVPIKEKLT